MDFDNFDFHAQTDPGLVRSNNEDIYAALPKRKFFALADGMGGHKAGEVAAKEAISHLCQSVEEMYLAAEGLTLDTICGYLENYIENSNLWVYHLSKKHDHLKGMGTTLCAALFYEKFLIHAHVGDSRLYRMRSAILEQVTHDHSLRNKMISKGAVDGDKLEKMCFRNVVTKAIGTADKALPEIGFIDVLPDDIFLLCSDGLSDYVNDEEILEILSRKSSLETITTFLVEAAKQRGGGDNITVLLVKVGSPHERPHLPG